MIVNGAIFFGLVVLAGVVTELCKSYQANKRRVQRQDLQVWRERQQSKWKVKYPSFQFEHANKWDGDIPVLVKKEK